MDTKNALKHGRIPCLLILLISFSLSACKKEKNEEGNPYDPGKPVVCESFFPNDGGVGTKLIIRGSNFGNDPKLVKVWIQNDENRPAKVIGVSDTRIYAVVPARADTGYVTVEIGEEGETQAHTFEELFTYEYRKNVATLCGGSTSDEMKDGSFTETQFFRPMWLAIDDQNNLFVLEEHLYTLRMLDLTAEITTTPCRVPIYETRTICLSPKCDTLYFGIVGRSNDVSTAVALRDEGFLKYKKYATERLSNASIVNPVSGDLFVNNYDTGEVLRWDKESQLMVLSARPMSNGTDFTFCWSREGTKLFCIGRGGADHSVIISMEYNLAAKTFSEPVIFAGARGQSGFADGAGDEARLGQPFQMIAGPEGDYYIADTYNHCIRRITANGVVSLYAGSPGSSGMDNGDPIKEAKFFYPTGLAMSTDGSILYVADKENKRICKILVE